MTDHTPHIDGLAKCAYERGYNPIDYAEHGIKILIELRDEIRIARAEDPAAFPGYTLPTDDATWSRRILGALMDAGWSPPPPQEAS